MDFDVLGPVRVRRGTREIALAGPLQRLLLSMLLAYANRPASVDVLIGALWGGEPEKRAVQRLQLHVYRLRQALGEPARVSHGPGGYRLRVSPAELDAARFEILVDEAVAVAALDPGRSAQQLRDALALWRGTPYDGLDAPALTAEAVRLSDRRLTAFEELYAAELAGGRHAQVVGELADLVREHPLRERLHALLMTALYLGGRQAEALRVYQDARRTLVYELGLEPGPQLREIEQQILSGEQVELAVQVPRRAVPAQLPHRVNGFTGREGELAELDALLRQEDRAVPISLISGTAGVGKTALAVHWAHQVRNEFADGQLYVDLRGYGPDRPLPPADVLAAFLRALGAEGAAIPSGLSERSAQFRSMLDGRRTLIVLDNAAAVDQVRPLLPGASSCFVLVTSRDTLAGLVAREGASRVDLDRMTGDDAQTLLGGLLGPSRTIDSDSAALLIERCARLPLAIRIAAEQVRQRGDGDVSAVLDDLAAEQMHLDLFDAGGDPQASVRSVFSWSYRQLDAAAARMFRLFGLHPGRDIDIYALAALTGSTNLREARRSLEALVRANVVDEVPRGRYRMHDLLRAYAGELAVADDGEPERRRAVDRLLDFYVRTATAAMRDIAPEEVNTPVEESSDPVIMPTFGTYEGALHWLDAERVNLITMADRTPELGMPSFTTAMSAVLWRYLDLGAYLDESQQLHSRALIVARETGDARAESIALRAVGMVHHRLDRYDEAARHLETALALQEDHGDRKLQAATLNNLAGVYHITGHVDDAERVLRRSLDLYRMLGDRRLQTKPLSNLGFVYRRLGRYDEASRSLEEALTIAEEEDHRPAQAHALVNLVKLRRDMGRYTEAIEYGQRVLTVAREGGIHNVKGYAMDHLGTVYLRLGDHENALGHHREALAVARKTGDNDLKARALNGIAEAHALAGDLAESGRHHGEALAVAASVGVRFEVARAHAGLGDIAAERGHGEAAREHWRNALEIYAELKAPEADAIRIKLA